MNLYEAVVGEGAGHCVSALRQFTSRGAGVARADPSTLMKPGTRARFTVDVERMQVFDAETEQAIWH